MPPLWQALLLLGIAAWVLLIAVPLSLAGFPAQTGHDFDLFLVGAGVAWSHGWSHLYDTGLQAAEYHRLKLGAFGPHTYFASPPQAAWLGLLFAWLPVPVANAAWAAISVGALIASWLIVRPGAGWLGAVYLLAAFAWYPVMDALHFGQTSIVLGACVALSWWLLRERRDVLAGLALAPLVLKPQLGLLLPVALLLRGRPRAFLTAAGSIAVLELVAAVELGPHGLASLLAVLQTVQAERLNRILGFAGWLPSPAALLLEVAAALVALWAVRGQTDEGAFAAAILGSLLLSPYLHTQDLAMLVIAGWLVVRLPHRPLWYAAMVAGLLAGEFINALTPIPFLAFEVLWLASLATPAAGRRGWAAKPEGAR